MLVCSSNASPHCREAARGSSGYLQTREMGLLCVDRCHVLAALGRKSLAKSWYISYLERAHNDKVCPVVHEVWALESHDLCKGQYWQPSPLRDRCYLGGWKFVSGCEAGVNTGTQLGWATLSAREEKSGERAGAVLLGCMGCFLLGCLSSLTEACWGVPPKGRQSLCIRRPKPNPDSIIHCKVELSDVASSWNEGDVSKLEEIKIWLSLAGCLFAVYQNNTKTLGISHFLCFSRSFLEFLLMSICILHRYFLLCVNYFFYGETVTDYFFTLVQREEPLRILSKYHRFISFALYLTGRDHVFWWLNLSGLGGKNLLELLLSRIVSNAVSIANLICSSVTL